VATSGDYSRNDVPAEIAADASCSKASNIRDLLKIIKTMVYLDVLRARNLKWRAESRLRQSMLCLDVRRSTRNHAPKHAGFHKSLQLKRFDRKCVLATRVLPERSSPRRCGYNFDMRILLRRRGVAMNSIDQGVLIITNANDFAPRRKDPLVTAVQAGVPGAFAQLYAIYSPRLYRTAIAITKNPEDAQDVLQETFLRAHLRVHRFEGRSSIYSWLSRIAINCAFMLLRKRRARPELFFDTQPDGRCETINFEPKDPALNPEEAYRLRQHQFSTLSAIRRLCPTLRSPLQMQMKHGWSVKEISQALNISESAVKSRLSRARQRLSMTLPDQKRFTTLRRQSVSTRAGEGSVLL
jgi:RNA polymerase sigma-70 factor, ECF subfamily